MLGIQYAQSPALGVEASRHPRLETEPRDLAAVRSYYRSVRKVSKLRVDFSSGIVFLVVAESHSLFYTLTENLSSSLTGIMRVQGDCRK